MELEVIRAVAAGAADLTIGIGVQIAGLSLDQMGDALPSLNAIYNYVDHPFVARKNVNREEAVNGKLNFPAFAIYLESPPQIDPEVQTVYRDGEYPVALSYLTLQKDDALRMRDALYVNRAVLRFLTQFNSNTNAAMRFRNNVNLWFTKSIVQSTPFDEWEGAFLAATTVVTWRVREHSP